MKNPAKQSFAGFFINSPLLFQLFIASLDKIRQFFSFQ